jgi:ribosomal protein L15
VHDADVLSNADADRFTETRNSEEVEERNFASVSLDTLDEKFLDGQRVTLNKLKKKGLVPEECNSLRVTAGTRLSKPLCVVADDYSFAAVKMIVLTGGRAIKLIPSPKPTTE